MTITVKGQEELVIPRSVRRKAGIKAGDRLELTVSPRTITISVEEADEYTPAQRRAINARLAEARKGPHHGPFETADAAIAFLRGAIKRRVGIRKKPKAG